MVIGKDVIIYATADTHGVLPDIPDCDILCIAGDISPIRGSHDKWVQRKWFEEVFLPWGASATCQIVVVPGNHDFMFERGYMKSVKLPDNVHVLIDQAKTINDVKFYGFPWCPALRNWAFYSSDNDMIKKANRIPANLDVLILHAPPNIQGSTIDVSNDIIDVAGTVRHFGCENIAFEILQKNPKFVICGHIHSGDHSPIHFGNSIVRNVSMMSEQYFPKYPIVELIEEGLK